MVTLYSGVFVLVDTNTSIGIHFIEMVTLYGGMFVLVEVEVEILILIPVHSWHPVLLFIVCQDYYNYNTRSNTDYCYSYYR